MLPIDGSGLRDVRIGNRILCLLGSRDIRQHIHLGAVRGNPAKISRQLIRRDKSPRPIMAAQFIPAPREKHESPLRADFKKNIRIGIGDVEQSRARDRRHLRGAIGPD